MDDQELSAFVEPNLESAPFHYYEALLKQCPEHAHLSDAEVQFLLFSDPVIRQGKQVLGEAHLPRVQGKLSKLFQWLLARYYGSTPDFLILLDREYWESGSDRDREILVYHEMCHCVHAKNAEGDFRFDNDGRPVWAIAPHDVEEFEAVVKRYGAYSPEILSFIAAAGEEV